MLPSTPGATTAALRSTWQCSQMRDEMPALESEQAELLALGYKTSTHPIRFSPMRTFPFLAQ